MQHTIIWKHLTNKVHWSVRNSRLVLSLQVKLVNIRNDDIADGNPKLTLGLIWTIILHFQVSFSVSVVFHYFIPVASGIPAAVSLPPWNQSRWVWVFKIILQKKNISLSHSHLNLGRKTFKQKIHWKKQNRIGVCLVGESLMLIPEGRVCQSYNFWHVAFSHTQSTSVDSPSHAETPRPPSPTHIIRALGLNCRKAKESSGDADRHMQ